MGWWEDITGTTDSNRARQMQDQAQGTAGRVDKDAQGMARKAGVQGQAYDAATAVSLGTSAADYMGKAQAAAQGQATQEAQMASTQAAQQAARAAKSGGMNAGEAALIGGQQVGNVYQNQLQQGMQAGRQQYAQGAQMLGGAASDMAGRQAGALGSQLQAGNLAAGLGAQSQSQANQIGQNWLGAGSMALGAVLSDRRAKRMVARSSGISEGIEDAIPSTSFEYKEGMGDGGGIPNEGVLAQDVEKSKIGGVVQTGPDGLKRMDMGKTLMAALSIISDLSSRISELEGGR